MGGKREKIKGGERVGFFMEMFEGVGRIEVDYWRRYGDEVVGGGWMS